MTKILIPKKDFLVCKCCNKRLLKFKMCGICNSTLYCDKICQLNDWDNHRECCTKLVKQITNDVILEFSEWIQVHLHDLKCLTYKVLEKNFDTHTIFINIQCFENNNHTFRINKYFGESYQLQPFRELVNCDLIEKLIESKYDNIHSGMKNVGLIIFMINFSKLHPFEFNFSLEIENKNLQKELSPFGLTVDEIIYNINFNS